MCHSGFMVEQGMDFTFIHIHAVSGNHLGIEDVLFLDIWNDRHPKFRA